MASTCTPRLWLAAALAASAAGPARAQAPDSPAAALADLRQIFIDLDANNDMAIERSEVPEPALPAFEKLLKLGDADKDGRLAGPELRAMAERLRALGGPAAGPAEIRRRLAARDKNGDGRLSREEFPGPAPLFDRLDADHDGFLTPEELQAARPGAAPRPKP